MSVIHIRACVTARSWIWCSQAPCAHKKLQISIIINSYKIMKHLNVVNKKQLWTLLLAFTVLLCIINATRRLLVVYVVWWLARVKDREIEALTRELTFFWYNIPTLIFCWILFLIDLMLIHLKNYVASTKNSLEINSRCNNVAYIIIYYYL